jgi:hypothetical protein
MFDVSIYGHLTFDRIFRDFKEDRSVGSMGNVWRALNKVNPKLKINLEPTDIGEALILVDTDKGRRASTANLSLKTRSPNIVKARWNHILYINELKEIDFISKITHGIVSADICRGRCLDNIELLKGVDFLFISDEDIFMSVEEIRKLVRKCVIFHHQGGSVLYNSDGSMIETNVEILDNINVLGCGDMLASFFINEHLNTSNVEESIKRAHNLVTKSLKQGDIFTHEHM